METVKHGAWSNPFCKILWSSIFVIAVGVWMTGCLGASSLEKEAQRRYSRRGESMTVLFSREVVSNAIVSWALTLTNGYVLYDNANARRIYTAFTNDLSNVFVLENKTNAIAPWGRSTCLPSDKSFYWAKVVIRVFPIAGSVRVSVAIHGRHDVRGLAWNIHTFEFDRQKDVDLPPCPQDERQVLDEILSTLRKRVGPEWRLVKDVIFMGVIDYDFLRYLLRCRSSFMRWRGRFSNW